MGRREQSFLCDHRTFHRATNHGETRETNLQSSPDWLLLGQHVASNSARVSAAGNSVEPGSPCQSSTMEDPAWKLELSAKAERTTLNCTN